MMTVLYPDVILPETNIFAPKNAGFQARNLLASSGLFSGAFAVSFREGILKSFLQFFFHTFFFPLISDGDG